MTASAAPVEPPLPVASARHTMILVAVLLTLALRGATLGTAGGGATKPPPLVPLYLSLIAAEWALVWAVARGIRRSGTTLRALVGGRWRTTGDVAADVVRALACWATVKLLVRTWQWLPVLGDAPHAVAPLLPHSAAELALWTALSVSAGVAEEVLFRGYFQRQFAAWTGSAWAALALQAVLFGASHGYQGLDASLRITLVGAIFGALALWRRSLRPGIIAHAWTDVASGVLRL